MKLKIKIIAIVITLISTFSSCTKCVTCVAYYSNGTVASNTQSVKVCNEAEIKAYENGTNYTDPSINQTPVRFQCR